MSIIRPYQQQLLSNSFAGRTLRLQRVKSIYLRQSDHIIPLRDEFIGEKGLELAVEKLAGISESEYLAKKESFIVSEREADLIDPRETNKFLTALFKASPQNHISTQALDKLLKEYFDPSSASYKKSTIVATRRLNLFIDHSLSEKEMSRGLIKQAIIGRLTKPQEVLELKKPFVFFQEELQELSLREAGAITRAFSLLFHGQIRIFNLWRKIHPGLLLPFEGMNLASCKLDGVKLDARISLAGADLSHSSMSRSEIDRTYLVNARLDETKLSDSRITLALFYGSSLRNADLRSVKNDGTWFYYADLSDADLRFFEGSASLNHADLTRALIAGDWSAMNGLEDVRFKETSIISGHTRFPASVRKNPNFSQGLRDIKDDVLDTARIFLGY